RQSGDEPSVRVREEDAMRIARPEPQLRDRIDGGSEQGRADRADQPALPVLHRLLYGDHHAAALRGKSLVELGPCQIRPDRRAGYVARGGGHEREVAGRVGRTAFLHPRTIRQCATHWTMADLRVAGLD